MPESRPVSPGVTYVRIEDDRAGQRLDNFLFGHLKGVPKSRIYRIIRDGQVRVNGRRAKQTTRLEGGDEVRIPPVRVAAQGTVAPVSEALAERLSRCLLYEDDALFIYNKPAGLAVHGGSGISLGLIEALREIYPGERNLELVHRLDRDTSGCIMVARQRGMLRRLQRLLQGDGMEKRYWLLCRGFKGKERVIEAPLLKYTRASGERMVKVDREGKASRTDFRVIERFSDSDICLLEALLGSGRTHQIRVHARFGGFPVLGDSKYGEPAQAGEPDARLYLHARSLAFRHPETGRQLKVEAPLDDVFDGALTSLRRK